MLLKNKAPSMRFLPGLCASPVVLRWNLSPCAGLLFCAAMVLRAGDLQASELPVVEAEGQPLAANVSRLITALQSIGQAFPAELTAQLNQAVSDENPVVLQRLLQPWVLADIHINPESRVKVERGPARAGIQQAGYTAFVVRIRNEADVTGRIRVRSPQAGPAYGGASRSILQRQDQTRLIDNELSGGQPRRFLHVDIHNQQPLTDRLSGLTVEYRLLLVYSDEAGRRDATLAFDVGQGTEDLGFRGEIPVLFDSQPAHQVSLRILDEHGKPSTARIEITDRSGRVYPPQARRLAPDFFFQKQIYRHDGETVTLPPGEFQFVSSRGPEYLPQQQSVVVTNDSSSQAVTMRLKRWIDPLEFGYASGDHHIHAAGCSHYTMPTEGVLPADMYRQVKGEGLNVGCVLTWGPCFEYQRQFFGSRAHVLSEPRTLLKYDLEISGFGSQALGHVCLLNLQNQVYPGSNGTKTEGWPSWTTPVMRWAREQGGVTGYAHSASGLQIDFDSATDRLLSACDGNSDQVLTKAEVGRRLLPEAFDKIDGNRDERLSRQELVESHRRAADQLPNLAIPEMNGVGAMEICVSTAEGVCDFISAMDTRRIQEWNTWYHILNCGFPLKVSGETDFPCMSSTRVGQGRVYVRLTRTSAIDYTEWCEGIREGKSYVSDGFAHALQFSVNQIQPGEGVVRLDQPGSVNVQAEVCFAPATPVAIAHGTLESPRYLQGDTVHLHGPRSNDRVQGGERTVELIINGQVAATRMVAADGGRHRVSFPEVRIDRSSWVALRQFPQLHTNPVDVLVADQPIRASADSARWCLEMMDLLWQNRKDRIRPEERSAAEAAFERARVIYRRIAAEAYRQQPAAQ